MLDAGLLAFLNSLRLLNKRPFLFSNNLPVPQRSLVNKDNLFYPEDKNRFAERGWSETNVTNEE